MPDRRFFEHTGPISLADLAEACGLKLDDPRAKTTMIATASPLAEAGEGAVAFVHDAKHREALAATKASAVCAPARFAELVPETAVLVPTEEPHALWGRMGQHLHPAKRLEAGQAIHPTARLEEGVVVSPGAVIGANAVIGARTHIGANAVIGPGVAIGRDCEIGSNVTVEFALLGDRVRLSSGAVIGAAGFGVAGSSTGAQDIPQLGRVILQDGVSIGANTCVDRGAWADTVVGENTKIDNQVQIGHNVVLGRNCMIAAHTGISGSVTVGDGVLMGGKVGIADHLKIGNGARLAAGAGLMRDVAPGETVMGAPARPARQFFREIAWLAKQAG